MPPRWRRSRKVWMELGFTRFNPAGLTTPPRKVALTVDEFEAVRLKDLEGLAQEDGANRMGISQPTFHRILASPRGKIADALVNGKAISIEGGDYRIIAKGRVHGKGRGRGGHPRQQRA